MAKQVFKESEFYYVHVLLRGDVYISLCASLAGSFLESKFNQIKLYLTRNQTIFN